jgi:pimeloyl-ACP methyl ester carboxylesterase
MARRSWWGRLWRGLLLLVLAVLVIGVLTTGGKPSPLQAPPGVELAQADALPGVQCTELTIPVTLVEDGFLEFDVVGDLCAPGEVDGRVLQVLVSGSGYGSVYWDFPYEPDTYSYVRAALRAGYAVFNFDRLGYGRSDHPFGLLLNVDRHADALAQVITSLQSGHDFPAVVNVGHSFGSVTSISHALRYPEQVDGIVLTGFAHNTNPEFVNAMRTGVDVAAFKGPFVGRWVDPTYLISKADTRGDTFYNLDNADPLVVATDELNRQTSAVGEAISSSKYFGPQSRELTQPVLMLLGENDFVVCGGELDCTDHAAAIAHEAEYFPPEACFEMVVRDNTDHNANLHRDAPENFATILDWIKRRVGPAEGSGPTEPCAP